MELTDTIHYMTSPDWKERFKAEYFQLKYRVKRLDFIISAYEHNALWFEPNTPVEVLKEQRDYMALYLNVLIQRALLEDIDIKE